MLCNCQRPKISKKFIAAVKLYEKPAYRLAQKAGLHYSSLSRIINGIDRPKAEDKRIFKLGRILGLSKDEIFEQSE